jgi:hypothetical protein
MLIALLRIYIGMGKQELSEECKGTNSQLRNSEPNIENKKQNIESELSLRSMRTVLSSVIVLSEAQAVDRSFP